MIATSFRNFGEVKEVLLKKSKTGLKGLAEKVTFMVIQVAL